MSDIPTKTRFIIAVAAIKACRNYADAAKYLWRLQAADTPKKTRAQKTAFSGAVAEYEANYDQRQRDIVLINACISLMQAEIVEAETAYPKPEGEERELPSHIADHTGGYRADPQEIFDAEDSILEYLDRLSSNIDAESNWASTAGPQIQRLIGTVAEALTRLLQLLQQSNELNDCPSIGKVEKAQLVALLEAALAELKAPYIDKSRWGTLMRVIRRVMGKAIEDGVSDAVEEGFKDALEFGGDLASELSKMDLPDLPFL